MLKFLRRGRRPNLVLVTVDQFRWDQLDVHPVFDRLGAAGVFFPLMITYAPYTIASMPAIFTGIYGSRNGVNAYFGPALFDREHCRSLAQYLQPLGYHTLGDTINELVVPDPGFDRLQVHDEYQDDLVERHCGLLREVAPRSPFFLYLHYSGIHTKVVQNVIKVYEEFDPRFFGHLEENRKRYREYALAAGEYVNAILGAVGELGIGEQTLLVVLTDHGCSLGERAGERAYGVYLYDYTVRTFAYFVWPRVLPAARTVAWQVRTVDVLPTILDLLRVPRARGFMEPDGESLLPLIEGRASGDRLAYMETGGLTGPNPSPDEPNLFGLRTRRWKLIYNHTTGRRELYDLSEDPDEQASLAGKGEAAEEELAAMLEKLMGRPMAPAGAGAMSVEGRP